MKSIIQDRVILCALLAILAGTLAVRAYPFASGDAILCLVAVQRPFVYAVIRWTYEVMLFTTPFIALLTATSLAVIFVPKRRGPVTVKLPPYPAPSVRNELFLVIGEVHKAKRPVAVESPRWLVIGEKGLFTGVIVFGAIGTGKTSSCMYPFAEQILAYRADDRTRRVGGLVMEVKGDFCHQVREILVRHGRGEDYLELSLDGDVRYNPLHSDLDAYALAYSIASIMNSLYGKSKEPFWQQAYTNLIKFVILLHKILYDYVTLFDVYECAINPDRLQEKLREGDRHLSVSSSRSVLISLESFMDHPELEDYPFELEASSRRMRAQESPELLAILVLLGVDPELIDASPAGGHEPWTQDKRDQFVAVRRWFDHDWSRMDVKLRASIVEGISVLLSLFDDNPQVKRVFCPPKETFDAVANSDGRYGRPLAPFAKSIENGVVTALNFPVATNPGLARMIGAFLKQDFQRAAVARIPKMAASPRKPWRAVLFLCDEYQTFATAGEMDPAGDEKFFALTRQARCIPIVATQSISSLKTTLPGDTWRTLLQTFRTKIFLALSDDFSARTASELCGKEEQLKLNYSISEQGQDAAVSVMTGQAAAHKSSMGTSKGYTLQRDFVFEPKVFGELRNAQAIVLAYDGTNPHPATYCYLKPYYLDPNDSYFEHLKGGCL